ncbi:glycosyltransferase family 4 protein [Candidatus Gottesmanbacteria bacterium]|nr:glycosyltransferase family 4 protein [Candidatus Gottesmanbacteria bacterium]
MKIGIDARLIDETGVGRYIRNLIENLGRLDSHNRYIVFLRKKSFPGFQIPNARWEKRLADVPWHTVVEQLVMPWLYIREHLDVVHVPYFNVPIFYPKTLIVTIHDVIILHFATGKSTTLPMWLYHIRRLGYWIVLKVGVLRARLILAVSETTKHELVRHFSVPDRKIRITHEGVDLRLQNLHTKFRDDRRIIKGPYFLYVGNVYPHKNIEVLTEAFGKISPNCRLVLVGRSDFFYERLRENVKKEQFADRVVFFGEASDSQLMNLYAYATALVYPSRMEGFGLPPLEALALECPVITSDIPIFREILGDLSIYFDPDNSTELANILSKMLMEPVNTTWKKRARNYASSFRWETMAERTLAAYEYCVRIRPDQ